ncbi:cell division protein FtsW [Leucobacter coleopterorum]|uniref:Probable peptidoglycan glycosyltransferase FtsW n=1 Tax=Leucobacter coleopterorum TaxID=2714933 RepID=A0ABX6K0N5_9MICO|nr:putative peptidoglycan glycosyltransferase FtsW [Leucobacter coleopterorum]QIM18630.1 cell division protein FtsW [Leucobacter coleopterorum]
MSTPTKATFVLPAGRPARFRLVPAEPGPLRRLTIILLTLVALLVGLGVIMVQSAGQVVAIANGGSPLSGLARQGGFALIGVCLLLLLSQVSTEHLRRYSWVALLFGITLQLLVYTPLGYEAGGNRNWLRLGPLSMQPAEFMKVVLLVWVSAVIATKQPLLSRWQHVAIPILPVVALSMAINVLGGDLGTLMIIAALVFGCLYFAQVRWRILGGIALLAALGVAVMTAIKPNRVFRVIQFLEIDCLTDPEHAHGMCWQSLNGFWALSNGGLFGAGVGNSKAKWSWLPESETDFIFAIIGEELGFVGAFAMILILVGIVVVLVALLAHCRTPFATSVIGGFLVWIGAQASVNISVVLGFIPVLGVPLPFVSAGGTSLISGLMAVGVVLSCVREEAVGSPSGTHLSATDRSRGSRDDPHSG